MSTETIYKLKVEKDPDHEGVFRQTTVYTCSNCWNYDGVSKTRNECLRYYSDSENGNLSILIDAMSEASAFNGGCQKGVGVNSSMPALKVFKRAVNRANRAGMAVPLIADPIKFAYYYSDKGDTVKPGFLEREISSAITARRREERFSKIGSVELPECFLRSIEIAKWCEKQGILECVFNVECRATGNKSTLRIRVQHGDAYRMFPRSRRSLYSFYPEDFKFLSLKKVNAFR